VRYTTRDVREFARRARLQAVERNLSLLAAGTAFWAVLSIFPAIIAIVTIYGMVASPDEVTAQVRRLGGSLSPATRDVVISWLGQLTSSGQRGLGFGLVAGLVAVLWAVSSGIRMLIKAISAAYEQEEDRSFLRIRGLAVVMSFGAVVVAVAMVAAVGAAPAIRHLVPDPALRIVFDVGEWAVLALILVAAIAVLYRVAPANTPATWEWASAGAVFATLLVVVASVIFSLYVRFFAHYNKTYGTLGGVVILMLWLYYCAYAVLLGALIDAEAERRLTSGVALLEQHPRHAKHNRQED
jgi:membrane protein